MVLSSQKFLKNLLDYARLQFKDLRTNERSESAVVNLIQPRLFADMIRHLPRQLPNWTVLTSEAMQRRKLPEVTAQEDHVYIYIQYIFIGSRLGSKGSIAAILAGHHV